MTTITSVQIFLPPGTAPFGKNSYRISDPTAVSKLVAFVNMRREVSPPSADTPPSAGLNATFYDDSNVVLLFGSGPGTFYVQCGSLSEVLRGTRDASAVETEEFQQLIARPKR